MSRTKESKAKELAEEQKKHKQTVTMIVIIVVIIAVLLAIALIINSRAIRRSGTAVTVGDTKYSVVDFNYFYYTTYANYVAEVQAQYPAYADMLLPDTTQPLSAQVFSDSTGETWDDRIVSDTMTYMTELTALTKAGHEAGYELSQDKVNEVETNYLAAQAQAEVSGVNLDELLERNYGKGITGERYHDLLLMQEYANEYSQHVRDSFQYSQDELKSYYAENRNNFDVYTVRTFYVPASDFDDGMTGAKAVADAYASEIYSEQDLIDAARDYDAVTYEEDDSTLHYYSGTSLSTQFYDWVTDDSREEGDVYVAENTANSVYHVLYFIERSSNDYPVANLRIITMYTDAVERTDDMSDEDYESAVAASKIDLMAEGLEVQSQWEDSEKDEETFQALYDEHTDDYYYDNGVFENFYRHLYPEEVDEWVYDVSREQGDSEIFYDADGSTCYFIVFDELGDDYCDVLARNDKLTKDFNAWDASIKEGLTAEKAFFFSLR